jgi:anti-anti-sigma regulatory factor
VPTGGLACSAFDTIFPDFIGVSVWHAACINAGVLRITSTNSLLVLEGQLAGPFAEELQSSWDGSKCVVDLTGVTFVDEAGARVLLAMKEAGVRFIACGVDTKQILAGLGKEAPSLRRCLSWMCRKEL